jgi:hypothetical protein
VKREKGEEGEKFIRLLPLLFPISPFPPRFMAGRKLGPPGVMFQKYLKKISGVLVAAGFSLRSFFLIISQAKACGYIFNAYE